MAPRKPQGFVDDAVKAAVKAAAKKSKNAAVKVAAKKVSATTKTKTAKTFVVKTTKKVVGKAKPSKTKKAVPTATKKAPSKTSAMPDWSSLTPEERGFATTFNRNTPAHVIKKEMIKHDMKLEGITQKGIRDISQTMAERKGMDMTRAYDFAESYQKVQRRGGRRPSSN
jgi:hypothetical protein